MASGGSPNAPAMTNREICAFCVLTQTVSLPSAQRAATARPSSGTGATRWLEMVRSTTTSQLPNAAGSAGVLAVRATLDPASGNSSDSFASAASAPTTAGSGS